MGYQDKICVSPAAEERALELPAATRLIGSWKLLLEMQDAYDSVASAFETDKEMVEEGRALFAAFDLPALVAECSEMERQRLRRDALETDKKLQELQSRKRALDERIAELALPLEPPKKKARLE